MRHPFGDLVRGYLRSKPGLTQRKLAEGVNQHPSVVARMLKGDRLTGEYARERVLSIVNWLHAQGTLTTVSEANVLLRAAGMEELDPLGQRADEWALLDSLGVNEQSAISGVGKPIISTQRHSQYTFGSMVYEIRQERGWSRSRLLSQFLAVQEDASEILSIWKNETWLGRVERDEVKRLSLREVLWLAKALQCDKLQTVSLLKLSGHDVLAPLDHSPQALGLTFGFAEIFPVALEVIKSNVTDAEAGRLSQEDWEALTRDVLQSLPLIRRLPLSE